MRWASFLSLPEIARVRLAAHAGALTLAAAALVLILAQRVPVILDTDGGAHVAIVSSELATAPEPPTPERLRERRAPSVERVAPVREASAETGEGQAPLRMWLNGAAGTVVFENPHDYLRCLDAALNHVQASGCPAPPPRLAEFHATRAAFVIRRLHPSRCPRNY